MITRDPYGISGAGYRGGRTLWAVPAAGLQPEKSWLPPTYQGEKAKTVP